MLMQDIEWSQEAYSLADFEYTFGKKLPQLIQVTDGFDGNELLHTFASEETYLVYSLATQSRIVVHDTNERLLSVPIDYHLAVREFSNGSFGTPRSLKQTIAEIAAANFSINTVVFLQNQPVAIQKGGSEMTQSQCGVMKIIDVHKQHYLVGLSVVEGVIDHRPVLIPVYVPIHVEVATSIAGRASDLPRDLLELIPSGLAFKPDEHFNKEIMTVSFSDIDGDGYEYVNPGGMHQTMTRISAKINGLRNQSQTHLSLPKQWLEESQELDAALNGTNPVDPKGTKESKSGPNSPSPAAAQLESSPYSQKSADSTPQETSGGHSPFLGAMGSVSMIDLSRGQTLTSPGIGRENPTTKYTRRSDCSKQLTKLTADQLQKPARDIPVSSMNIHPIGGEKVRPSVPPKPKVKNFVKRKAKNWFVESPKKYAMDTNMMNYAWDKERPSLRNAKSLSDLHRMSTFEPEGGLSIPAMHIIEKPQMREKQNKLKFSDEDIDLPKRKSVPLLSRISGLFSGFTTHRNDRPKAQPKPKDKGRKKTVRVNESGDKYFAKTDIKLAAYRASDVDENPYAEWEDGYSEFEGGNTIYAVPTENTIDLLSDIRRVTKERHARNGGFPEEVSKAPELPPRNNLPSMDNNDIGNEQLPVGTPSVGTSTTENAELVFSLTNGSERSDHGSFSFDFNPSAVVYTNNPSGHLAEPESEGDTSDSTDTDIEDNNSGGDIQSATLDDKSVHTSWIQGEREESNFNKCLVMTNRDTHKGANFIENVQVLAKGILREPEESSFSKCQLVSGRAKEIENKVDIIGKVHTCKGIASELTNRKCAGLTTEAMGANIGVGSGPVGHHQRESSSWSQGASFTPAPKPPVPIKPTLRTITQDNQGEAKYRSWSDIPKDISQFTVHDLVSSLHLLKMTRHEQAFFDNDIDGELLLELEDSVLQSDFGFSAFDSKKLVKFAKGWRPKLR